MNGSKTVKIGIAALFLIGGAAFFYKKVYVPKSTYAVYYASKGTTAVEVFGIGELDAKDIYPVGTSTGGKILTVETDQGRYIKKDDLIAKVDPVDLKKKMNTVKVSLKRAKVDLESAKQELTIAKEQNDLTLSTYQKDLQVYQAKGISRLAYEKSKTAMLTAKTKVAISQSKVASMTIRLEEIQNNIEGMQKRLSQLTITSPIDGYVIE
jgi:multidrug efflux pump subunit AcrA (membrane-fusion protein)